MLQRFIATCANNFKEAAQMNNNATGMNAVSGRDVQCLGPETIETRFLRTNDNETRRPYVTTVHAVCVRQHLSTHDARRAPKRMPPTMTLGVARSHTHWVRANSRHRFCCGRRNRLHPDCSAGNRSEESLRSGRTDDGAHHPGTRAGISHILVVFAGRLAHVTPVICVSQIAV